MTFKAMHLDHWPQVGVHDARLVDASFTGTVVVSGEDRRKLSINLKVKNQVSFRIRLMGVQANGEKSPDDIIEKVFAPGEGDFHVDGQIVNFYGKRKME